MADTGSEVAEGATRGTTGTIARMLERRFLWNRPHEVKSPTEEGDIDIKVRCPRDEVDKRAEEVLEALERMKIDASCTIDDKMASIILHIPRAETANAQRALERLHASKRSEFTINDVIGLDRLEEETGRRTLGSTRDERAGIDERRGGTTPIESSVLTFANHPSEPALDEREAKEYAKGMRDLGFDTAHRPVERRIQTDGGPKAVETRHVVDVSYLETDREEFVLASTLTLHRIGALAVFGAEDPYLGDEASFRRDLEWLDAQSATRSDEFERNLAAIRAKDEGETRRIARSQEGAAEAPERTSDEVATGIAVSAAERDDRPDPEQTVPDSSPARGQDASEATIATPAEDGQGLTAEEYSQLPARERAGVDPKHIPDDAFGKQDLHDAIREQASAAAVLNADKEPIRTHPSIGERVG